MGVIGRWRPRRLVRQQGLELLEHACELVATRDRFTRVVWARDRHSHPVSFASERAVRFCAAGALLRAEVDLFGGRNLALDDEEKTARPERLEYAFSQLGYELGQRQMPKLGLFLVDADRIERLALLDPPLAALMEQVDAAQPTVSWAETVIALNEEKTVSHADILAGYEAAIATARRNLEPRSPRRRS